MIYLDYSREAGEWMPNEFGGRENLEAIVFLKELNEQAHLQYPGVLTIAEESTAWPGVSRPTYLGGLGFSLKWNMGWMNDTIRYMRHEPIHRKYHHDELTFSLIYAFHENFVPAAVARRSGPRQGFAPGPDARRPVAEVRQPAAALQLHVDASRQEAACSWAATFGQWNEWNYDTSLQWHLLQWESHQGVQKCVADLNRLLPPRAGAARSRFRLPRLRVDRLPQLPGQHVELHPPRQGPGRLSHRLP